MRPRRRHGPFALAILLLASAGCATNPVTGKRDFVMMTEDSEIALGQRYHRRLLEEYRVYQDPVLQAYVDRIGQELAAHCHRPDLSFRFTVLDSPEVNAFALPGGHVYVTRGILAYFESEAELAGVLGHEIGHVTARHAVRQHAKSQLTGIIATIFAAGTGYGAAGDLVNAMGTVVIRGYGRDEELEADRLGAEYLARAGYDPRTMLRVIGVLKDQEAFERRAAEAEDREPHVYHGLFATHPDNDLRLQGVVDAARVPEGVVPRPDGRDAYLDAIDGLVFGDSPQDGYVRGRHFVQPGLGFALTLPEGWKVGNRPRRVTARGYAPDAVIELTLANVGEALSARQVFERKVSDDRPRGPMVLTGEGGDGYSALARVRSPWGKRDGRAAVFLLDGEVYLLTAATREQEAFAGLDAVLRETVQSFRRLSAEEREIVPPPRIRVVTAGPEVSYEALAEHVPLGYDPVARLRLLNGHFPRGEPLAGQRVKTIE